MAPPVVEYSVKEFADLAGVSAQRVYQWIQQGMPHRRGSRGAKIVPREGIRWLRERERDEARKEFEKVSMYDKDEEQARKLRAEADLKEIELEERRRKVVPLDEFTLFVENFAGGFASVATGQLNRFERDMVAVTTPAEAHVLRRKMAAALMRGAQDLAQRLESEATTLDESEGEAAA